MDTTAQVVGRSFLTGFTGLTGLNPVDPVDPVEKDSADRDHRSRLYGGDGPESGSCGLRSGLR